MVASPVLQASLRRPSLRSRLLRHVMLPLLLTWALGSGVALAVAFFFTQKAFDRSMLDDAYLLASHLQQRGDQLVLDVSAADLNTVLFDQSESVFFAVLGQDGRLIAGHAGLTLPQESRAGAEVEFIDLHYKDQRLRAVSLRRDAPLPARVIVALTTRSRSELLRQLMLYSVAPQILLLIALAAWLRRGISQDLVPLAGLREVLTHRDAADLSPLPRALSEQAGSRDVQDLAVAVNALFERLALGISAQREFAGNVAHELKTPLAGLRAAAEYGLAQSDAKLGQAQLQAVLQSQQRASHLVDQLLALALADEARTAVRLARTRLDECVRDVLLHYLAQADRQGVELAASGLDEAGFVLAERGLLEGLLGNLLDNAFRYGGRAEGGGTVSVDLQRVGAELCLSVSDQGPGIAPEQRLLLTRRWAQGSGGVKLGQGAGLGLSIVSRYAELMRARLSLQVGDEGRGLRVQVFFPALD